MSYKRLILVTLLTVLLTPFCGEINAVPYVMNHYIIPKSQKDLEAERLSELHEAYLTDSLLNSITVDSPTREAYSMNKSLLIKPRILGSLKMAQYNIKELTLPTYSQLGGVVYAFEDEDSVIYPAALPVNLSDPIPEWFKKSIRFQNQIQEASFRMMVDYPATIEYADWNLPEPPRLPNEDYSFHAFLKRMNLPDIDPSTVVIPVVEPPRKNWLHTFNVSLQLSQAYVSSNWYQGGNSYVAGLFGFLWNVDLNTVFHPNLLFQSSLQYKLAVNSNPKGSLHKYNTSQDLFQYNLKTGLKAFNHWFYSLNLLFQTQLFNSYPEDSLNRTSSLLSPGTLNIGLGMTYTLVKKGANFSVSISPLAYNLKTCIAKDIDHLQFNIQPNRKTVSEIGSSAEANLTWNFNQNISWKSRLFLFTDYSYFLADWENTFNFQLNKFLSTQIYLHPRFDSSSEMVPRWRYWMFREILSFGISYTFATAK